MAKRTPDSQEEGLALLFSLEEFRAAKANANLVAERQQIRAQQREQRQKIKKEQALQNRENHVSKVPEKPETRETENPLATMLAAYFSDPLAFSGESEYQLVNNIDTTAKKTENFRETENKERISAPRQESILPPIDSDEPNHLNITGLALRKLVAKLDECFRKYQQPLDNLGEQSLVPEKIGSQMNELFRCLNRELILLTEKADRDPKWVAQVLAKASLRVNNGLFSLFFAQLWQTLAEMIKGEKLTPVVLLQWLRSLENAHDKVFLTQVNRVSEGLLLDLLNDLDIELQTQGNVLSIEDLLLRSWVSAQVSYTDGVDANSGKIDPYATVFLLVLATAAQLYMELTETENLILEPTIDMISEISNWEKPAKVGALKHFQICWQGELEESRYQHYRRCLEEKACYGSAVGISDEFGIGERAFNLITTRPQGNLKLLPNDCGYAQIKKIFPSRPAFEASPYVENLVLGNQWGNVAPKKPAVWAFTGAIGMVAELAEAGVQVFYNPEIKPIKLRPLLADFEEPLLELVPGSVTQANLLKQEINRLSLERGQYPQVQIAPSVNELQMLQLALETILPVEVGISQKDLDLLQQSRCYQALSSQRTWEISRIEDLDTVSAGLEDNEEYIRVLVPARVDSSLLYRLQILISEKSPGSRVDYINTMVGEQIILGVLD